MASPKVTTGGCSEPILSSTMELPLEAITEILARLPVRTLLRCRSVCRSWRSLIRDPYFIAHHLKRSSSDPTRFLIATYLGGGDHEHLISLLCCETLEVLQRIRIEIPELSPSSVHWVVSSVNGVVCLQWGSRHRIILLNPATREIRYLQDPISSLEDSWEWHFGVPIGFGYSRRIADHKLVRIQPLKVGLERRYEAHVLALKEGVWREVDAPALSCGVIRGRRTVVDGVVHWLVRGDMILSFDLGNDKFGQQSLPNFGEEDGVTKMLSVFNESLRLTVYPSPYDAGSLTVWVRNSQCVWTRLMRIDRDFRSFEPVGWGSRGEFFMDYDYHYLVAYEPTTRVLRDVQVDAEKRPSYCDFHLYRESLVPLR